MLGKQVLAILNSEISIEFCMCRGGGVYIVNKEIKNRLWRPSLYKQNYFIPACFGIFKINILVRHIHIKNFFLFSRSAFINLRLIYEADKPPPTATGRER